MADTVMDGVPDMTSESAPNTAPKAAWTAPEATPAVALPKKFEWRKLQPFIWADCVVHHMGISWCASG